MKKAKQKKPQFKHPVSTREGHRERAVAVLLDPYGLVQQKWEFLREKGMSDDEILEALNDATDGEVIRIIRKRNRLEGVPSLANATAFLESRGHPEGWVA